MKCLAEIKETLRLLLTPVLSHGNIVSTAEFMRLEKPFCGGCDHLRSLM